MLTWEKNIGTISKISGKYPPESYATVARAIHIEWVFLKRVTWDMGGAFAGVKKLVW